MSELRQADAALVREISELKRTEEALRLNEQRLEALLTLNRMTDAPVHRITNFALEEAVKLTGSRIGYLAFMNEDESVLTMHAWSKTAMKQCAVIDKPIVYPIETTGLWGEAVRQRKPIITNDYFTPNPLKKGIPQGHVPVKRHMNVPVFDGEKIVAVAGVGNKEEEYNDSDIRQLTLLMEGMWQLLQRKKTDEALRKARDELEQRVEERTAELEEANRLLQAEIAGRKQFERELRESERRLRTLYEGIDEGIFVHDEEGRILDCNDASCRRLGYTREEMLSMTTKDIDDPEFAEGFENRLSQQRTEGALSMQGVHITKDGRRIPVDISTTVIDYHDKPAVLAVVHDISVHKEMEEALRNERDYSASIINGTPAVICGIAPDGTTTFINPAGERITGYSSEELVGKNWWKTFYPGDEYKQVEQLFRDFEEHGNVRDYEMVLTDRTGGKHTISWNSINRVNEKGDLLEIIGFGNDITERKRAEDALAFEQYLLSSLMDNIPDSIYFKDTESRFIRINKSMAALFGLDSPSDALGKTDFDFFTEEHARPAREDEQKVMESGQSIVGIEEKETWADGRVRWVSTTKVPLRDEHGNIVGTYGISRNITMRKRAEERLKQTLEELERSNRDLEQFAYIASHDLQEPLRMISSFTQLLGRRYKGQLDESADEYIQFAVEGAKRMQKMLNDLLAYSRVSSSPQSLKPIDCESVFEQTIANLKLAVEDASAKVTHDPLPTVLADETQLIQLFQNLIGNALKFRNQDAPKIHISARRRDGRWAFTVSDNGVGIEPEHFDRVFQVFQRACKKSRYPGTGIGLAICRKIVQRHGGRIHVESEPGKGSVFHFDLQAASPAK